MTGLPHVHFPNETQGHQHVHHADVVVAVPEGQKCLLWFSSTCSPPSEGTENSASINKCVLIELGDMNRMGKRYPIKTCFHSSLAHGSGTILQGTCFKATNLKTFAVHDIHCYKGTPYSNISYTDKLKLFVTMFQHEIQQVSYFADHVVLGLPIMFPGTMTHEDLRIQLQAVPYKVEKAQYRYSTRKDTPVVNVSLANMMSVIAPQELVSNPSSVHGSVHGSLHGSVHGSKSATKFIDYRAIRSGRIKVPDMVFLVKPELQNDVYRICTSTGDHGIAAVQSYDSSKFLNRLFRHIKENDNLDLLEESDDDDEFENIDMDKYVDLEKTHKLLCRYLPKMNKWEPYKVADRGARVAYVDDVQDIGRDNGEKVK